MISAETSIQTERNSSDVYTATWSEPPSDFDIPLLSTSSRPGIDGIQEHDVLKYIHANSLTDAIHSA